MKEIESVTDHIGTAEAVPPAEETGTTEKPFEIHSVAGETRETSDGGQGTEMDERAGGAEEDTDPWQALAKVGTLLASALGAFGNPASSGHIPGLREIPRRGDSISESPFLLPKRPRVFRRL